MKIEIEVNDELVDELIIASLMEHIGLMDKHMPETGDKEIKQALRTLLVYFGGAKYEGYR